MKRIMESKAFTHDEISRMNSVVKKWGRSTGSTLDGRLASLTGKQVNVRYKYNLGLLEAVGFKFPRYGVFLEMGVFGGLSKKEHIARGTLQPRPWFNPVIDANLPKLGRDLGKLTGQMIINALQIKIKNT